jgi:hypothetical protein
MAHIQYVIVQPRVMISTQLIKSINEYIGREDLPSIFTEVTKQGLRYSIGREA